MESWKIYWLGINPRRSDFKIYLILLEYYENAAYNTKPSTYNINPLAENQWTACENSKSRPNSGRQIGFLKVPSPIARLDCPISFWIVNTIQGLESPSMLLRKYHHPKGYLRLDNPSGLEWSVSQWNCILDSFAWNSSSLGEPRQYYLNTTGTPLYV